MRAVMQEQWRPSRRPYMRCCCRRGIAQLISLLAALSHGSKQHEPVERESKLTRAGSSSTIMAVMADHDGAVSEPSVGPGSQRARVSIVQNAPSALDRRI